MQVVSRRLLRAGYHRFRLAVRKVSIVHTLLTGPCHIRVVRYIYYYFLFCGATGIQMFLRSPRIM